MKKGALILLLVIGILVAGYATYGSRSRRGDGNLRISGNLELTQVSIAFKMPGRLVELDVDEGAPVKKGMVVARLDRDQLLHQLAAQKAALETALHQRDQASSALDFQREAVSSDIDQRRAELAQAESRSAQLETGSRPQEIQEAQAGVNVARAENERAAKDWERAQALYKNEDISTAQFDQFRSRFEGSTAALKQAEERAALVREGPRKEELAAARAQIARARAALQMAEASRLELRRREEEVLARESEVDRTRAQVALVQSQLEDTVSISPIDGVVLVRSADVGEVLSAGAPVVTIGDIDHPWLRGYIGEQDLGRVKLGSQARITTDSYPGQSYAGRISFIASQAEFTPKQIQTQDERIKLVYRIKIDIGNPRRELKLNMPADAEIPVHGN